MAKEITEAGAARPGQDEIARRAHEIWESEGCPDGRAVEHWFRAVSELKAQYDGQPDELRVEKPRASRRTAPRAPQRRFQPTGQ